MPPQPQGPRPLTIAERQARHKRRRAEQAERWRAALERIRTARTVVEARKIAAEALCTQERP